ncbi:GNAT family N-acetyltransferase [Actinophytocola sp.]|uniref:GNAT family N-acetyltransferase n=1 Tax=Actinophytocola sp. TaxID=1872138 RepID=UPI003D6C14CF
MSDLDIGPVRDEPDLDALTNDLGHGPLFRDRFQRQKSGKGQLLFARRDDSVVGVVYLWLEPAEEKEIRDALPRVPLLMHLEIREDERGQGYGTALIEAAEEWLKEEWGCTKVALAVEVGNENAKKLYERLGYKEWAPSYVWEHPYVMCRRFVEAGQPNPEPEYEQCNILIRSLVEDDA